MLPLNDACVISDISGLGQFCAEVISSLPVHNILL